VTPVMNAVGLRKDYGCRTVLDLEGLAVRSGEILAVMGPSGAGKTTLLRLLATLERPSAGCVRFGELTWSAGGSGSPRAAGAGRDGRHRNGRLSAADLLRWRRRTAFVTQNPVLFTGTVRDNVALGLHLRGLGPDAAAERVDWVLDMVGLTGLAGAPADSLSAGEAQRVSLARALVTRPEVLLLDEPTANLDPGNVALIENVVRKTAGGEDPATAPAVVVVTHNLFQARRLAHRAALLVSGRLIEVGQTRQVFENPVDLRTEAFVKGEMVF